MPTIALSLCRRGCVRGAAKVMAQKGITAFFQAPAKLRATGNGTGIVRAAALSSPEVRLLGSTTPEAKPSRMTAALEVSNANYQALPIISTPVAIGIVPAGSLSTGENPDRVRLKQRLAVSDLAPALAKRARTSEAGASKAQDSTKENVHTIGIEQDGGELWEKINETATTSGRPPLSPKYRKKSRARETEVVEFGNVEPPMQSSKEGRQEQPSDEAASQEQEGVLLTGEQRLKIENSKAAALAKLAQRRAEEMVAAAHGAAGSLSFSMIQSRLILAHSPLEHVGQTTNGELMPRLGDLLLDKSWLEALPGELQKPYFANLEKFVGQEVSGKVPIYPPQASIFRAFNTCPFDRVKVVILGQDPYHGPGQAMGLSFSVPAGVRTPPSLQNIFKELQEDLGCSIPPTGDLQKWASQGVLLLNTVLTVRQGQANSHSKRGWEVFTDAAIRALSKQRQGLIFLLWGRPAQEKVRLIDASSHHILKCAHPSGLSAHRGFFGCKHFSQANKILHDAGNLPIDWQL